MVASTAGFFYLAYTPQAILFVETYQPGASYKRAKDFIEVEDYVQALKWYERGVKYFKQLHEESGLDRHKIFVSEGLLGIAYIYHTKIEPPMLDLAEDYYVEALDWYSDWNLAQPYYSLANVRYDAGMYEDAIEPLTTAIHKGLAPTNLQALYLRGLCYFNVNQYELAAKDWINYLRFYSGQIPTERWNQMAQLSEKGVDTPEALFIRGLERFVREEPEQSLEYFEQISEQDSFDIASKYYVAQLNGTPTDSGFGNREISSLFPKETNQPQIRLWERFVDIYCVNEMTATISMTLTVKGNSPEPHRIAFYRNDVLCEELIEKNGETNTVKITCSFSAGKNVLRIREENPYEHSDGNGVFLFSLSIKPNK